MIILMIIMSMMICLPYNPVQIAMPAMHTQAYIFQHYFHLLQNVASDGEKALSEAASKAINAKNAMSAAVAAKRTLAMRRWLEPAKILHEALKERHPAFATSKEGMA